MAHELPDLIPPEILRQLREGARLQKEIDAFRQANEASLRQAAAFARGAVDTGLTRIAWEQARLLESLRPQVEEFNRAAERFFGERLPDLGPGVTSADLHFVQNGRLANGDVPKELREEALTRMASGIAARWKLWGATKRALALRVNTEREERERQGQEPQTRDAIKLDIMRAGILLAAADRTRPQYIRLGKWWVTDEKGKKVSVRPEEFSLPAYVLWFRTAAIAAAEATLLDEQFPRPEANTPDAEFVPLDESIRFTDVRGDSLSALIRQEEFQRFAPLLENLSEEDRELLYLVADGDSTADAARKLGIKPGTARQRMKRLRGRIGGM